MLLDSDSLHGARNFPARRRKAVPSVGTAPLRGERMLFPWCKYAVSLVQVCCFLGASMLFSTRKDAFFDGQRASLQAK